VFSLALFFRLVKILQVNLPSLKNSHTTAKLGNIKKRQKRRTAKQHFLDDLKVEVMAEGHSSKFLFFTRKGKRLVRQRWTALSITNKIAYDLTPQSSQRIAAVPQLALSEAAAVEAQPQTQPQHTNTLAVWAAPSTQHSITHHCDCGSGSSINVQ